jgi:hypothetical protein
MVYAPFIMYTGRPSLSSHLVSTRYSVCPIFLHFTLKLPRYRNSKLVSFIAFE